MRWVAVVVLVPMLAGAQPAPDPGLMAEHRAAWVLAGQLRKEEARRAWWALIEKAPAFHRAYDGVVDLARHTGDLEGAEREFRAWLRREPGNALAYYGLARTLHAAGRHEQALQAYRRCVERQPRWFGCHEHLGAEFVDAGHRAAGVRLFQSRLARAPHAVADLIGLASAMLANRQYADARRVTTMALGLARTQGDAEAQMLLEYHLAHFPQADGAPAARRSELYRAALARPESWGDEDRVLMWMKDLAFALAEEGDPNEAEKLFRQALERARVAGNEPWLWFLHHELSRFHQDQGATDTALATLLQAGAHCERLAPGYCACNHWLAMTVLRRQRGEYGQAMQAAERHHAVAVRHDKPWDEAYALKMIGLLHADRGDYTRSLDYQRRSVALFRQLRYDSQAGVGEGHLGDLHWRLGELGEARRAYTRSLATARALPYPGEQVRLLSNLGNLALREGRLAEAERLLREALAVAGRIGDRVFRPNALLRLGEVLDRQGRRAAASEMLARGLAEARTSGSVMTLAGALLAVGRHELRGGPVGATDGQAGRPVPQAVEGARERFEELLKVAEPVQLAELVWEGHLGLGECWEALGDAERALQEYRAAIAGVEGLRAKVLSPDVRAYFFSDRTVPYQRALRLLNGQPGTETLSFELAERLRARSFLDSLAESPARGGRDVTAEQADELGRLTKAVSRALGAVVERNDEPHRRALREAEERLEEHWERVRRTDPQYADLVRPEPVSVADVQAQLGPQAALVAFFLGAPRSLAWVVTRERLVQVALPARGAIEGAARALRAEIGTRPRGVAAMARQERAARRACDTIVTPLRPYLRPSLVWVPDGALHELPLESLDCGDGPLLRHHTVAVAPSASVYVRWAAEGPGRRPTRDLLAYGDPVIGRAPGGTPRRDAVRALEGPGGTFAPLPHAREEVLALGRLFARRGSVVRTGAAATEASLKAEPLHEYKRLHLASHAVWDAAVPARSGVLLAPSPGGEDGVLHFHEVLRLRLAAEVVTLSACQTAGVPLRGEGLGGLARAFHYAGARRLVASLWPVSDAATAQLMARLYGEMGRGTGVAEALRRAKLHVAASGVTAYRHPYFWAGFVLIGPP